jgi:hypothetical protein
LTEITINQSESNKDTASLTLYPTEPTNVSNMNVPQKKKQKKNDITSTLGTRRNTKRKLFLDEDSDDRNVPDPTEPTDVSNVKVLQKKKQKKNDITSSLGPSCNTKRKNDLHEDSDDCNVPHPPAAETNVPTYVCNWAQAIICKYPQLPPMKCQHIDCELLVQHICQAAWEQREGHQETVTRYCCLHHPQYKYQHVVDRSGVSKKQSSLSTNKGQELSVDLDATIAKQNMNVTKSVLDGKNKQVRDVSASLTSSMQDMTVSHFNESRKDIEIDGHKYRCNKVS